MGTDALPAPQAPLADMGKAGGNKSDSALEMWRCTLETDEGAFELKSVLYDYAQPPSPNASTVDFSAASSSSPRVSSLTLKEGEEEVDAEEKEAAMVEALKEWHEAATRAADLARFRPSQTGVLSRLREFLFGERTPTAWWMRKNWRDGDKPRGVLAGLTGLLDRNEVRLATTAGVLALVSVGVQKYLQAKA